MKLTERDKKLLIGLGIFIFVVVFVRFLFLPKLSEIKTLNLEINELNNTYAVNAAYKNKANKIDSDIKVLSARLTDLRKVYPPKIDIPELVVTIKNLSKASNLEFKTINFENYKAVENEKSESKSDSSNETNAGTNTEPGSEANNEAETDDTSNSSNNLNNQNDSQSESNSAISAKIKKYFYLCGLESPNKSKNDYKIEEGSPYSINVKLEGEGTNEQIKAFFTNLEKLDTNVYCNSVSISGPESGKSEDTNNELKITASLTFYGIMDSAASGYYLLPDGKWSPVAPADDKTNMFKEYAGFSSINKTNLSTANTINDSKPEKYDFAIVASSFGGGLSPSVSIICRNPETNTTYTRPVVYGDNKGVENAEIFIEEKNGRTFCKFKTDYESYPDTQYSKTFEFIPNEKDLSLVILSSKRCGENDKAGIKLNIINNTKRTFKYIVKNDDEKSPRIKIGKTVGSVINEK